VKAHVLNCGGVVDSNLTRQLITLYLKTSQTTDTTVYRDEDVKFFIDSVGIVGNVSNTKNFNFIWMANMPDRFDNETDNWDTVRLKFAYLTSEVFTVKAVEQSPTFGLPCTITDTVRLHVEGSYSLELIPLEPAVVLCGYGISACDPSFGR
jgi:hypothetical protein